MSVQYIAALGLAREIKEMIPSWVHRNRRGEFYENEYGDSGAITYIVKHALENGFTIAEFVQELLTWHDNLEEES